MIVLCGTYEGLLLGWKLERSTINLKNPSENDHQISTSDLSSQPTLKLKFTTDPEIGCIKSLALSRDASFTTNFHGRLAACSGSNATSNGHIALFDLKANHENGTLSIPDSGSVSVLAWIPPPVAAASIGADNHQSKDVDCQLIAGLESGALVFWKGKVSSSFRMNELPFKMLSKAHKGPIVGLAVHPSGKICLSIGGGASFSSSSKGTELKLWDLASLTMAHKLVICKRERPLGLRWNPQGTMFAVHWEDEIVCYSLDFTDTEEPISIKLNNECDVASSKSKFVCFDWKHQHHHQEPNNCNQSLLIGLENGNVAIAEILSDSTIQKKTKISILGQCHVGSRVKAIKSLPGDEFITASSNGCLALWKRKESELIQLLDSHETGFRILTLETSA